MTVTFAYVSSIKGPVPQKWHGLPTNGAGASPTPLQSIDLPDAYDDIPLDQLVKLYPYKGAPQE